MHSNITRHHRLANDNASDTPAIVLVIDDDCNITAAVSKTLAAVGYTVIRCHSCDAAIQAARAGAPDMVIADINIAGHNGVELCQQLRAEANMSDVPCMYLSGAQTPDIIRRSHDDGAAYHLRKPFDAEVLVDLVEKVMWVPEPARGYAAAHA